MCESSRESLANGERAVRILIGIFTSYTLVSNTCMLLSENELRKYLLISNLASSLSTFMLTYINEYLKNEISNYEEGGRQNRTNNYHQQRTQAARPQRHDVKRPSSWIPFTYTM